MRASCPLRRASPGVYRRFRRAYIGELWQHDSSIRQWWPATAKQTLLLATDDHSGLNLAGRFVTSDTTWNHFEHFRETFGKWGLPEIVYTDGLSLFGPSSSNDHSEFQRAFRGLGVADRVAPSPQAKGKIERGFGTFQRRLVTLLSHTRATTWKQADVILQMEIARQNRTVNCSTGSRPLQLWQEQVLSACGRMRPVPPPSLISTSRCAVAAVSTTPIPSTSRDATTTSQRPSASPSSSFAIQTDNSGSLSIPSPTFGLLF